LSNEVTAYNLFKFLKKEHINLDYLSDNDFLDICIQLNKLLHLNIKLDQNIINLIFELIISSEAFSKNKNLFSIDIYFRCIRLDNLFYLRIPKELYIHNKNVYKPMFLVDDKYWQIDIDKLIDNLYSTYWDKRILSAYAGKIEMRDYGLDSDGSIFDYIDNMTKSIYSKKLSEDNLSKELVIIYDDNVCDNEDLLLKILSGEYLNYEEADNLKTWLDFNREIYNLLKLKKSELKIINSVSN
jgi:hypothetical protein